MCKRVLLLELLECLPFQFLAAGAAGAGAIFTDGTLSAAAWGAILSAAGFSTAYVSTCMAYDQSCKDAYDAYWNTYYNSTIL